MTTYELRRIAQTYFATEAEVRAAEHTAVHAPLVPLGRIRLDVLIHMDICAEEPDHEA